MKVANPSSEEVTLHCGTQIGTFHSTSGNNTDEYAVMESSNLKSLDALSGSQFFSTMDMSSGY